MRGPGRHHVHHTGRHTWAWSAGARRRRTLFGFAFALCAALPALATAAEIERAEIRFRDGAYRYYFAATLNANIEAVRAVVGDYERLARLNDDIITSHLIERYDEHRLKRRLLVKHCLLVFCFNLDFVERVETLPNGDIETHIIPEESNFHRGASVWRITALDADHTRVTLEADQEPKFWIPPVIGPLIIKGSFVAEVTETLNKLERLAGEHLQ